MVIMAEHWGQLVATCAPTSTLTHNDATVVVIGSDCYDTVLYTIKSTEIVDYEPVVLEEIDWLGLARSYRWRAGFELNKKSLIYRKMPGGDYHHKRKQRIQKMRHIWK